jgi:hypothetical protein
VELIRRVSAGRTVLMVEHNLIALGDQPRLYQTGIQSRELLLTNEKGRIRIRGYAELI